MTSRSVRPIRIVILGILSIAFSASAQDGSLPITGLQRDVVFTEYSPLSRSVELARRTLSPLTNLEITRASANSPLRLQAIDLAQETFTVYVPVKRPSLGYGLLAFIPPWQDARLPAGWAAILDENGLIFISAARSGNQENVIDRRMPLALLGAYNIMKRYAIDTDRLYVGGFSGGARIAMRVSLAYPDLFRGALLNAGCDPLGLGEVLLPPDDLFNRFQSSSRVVYVTGSEDSWNMQHDMDSRDSMLAWCAFGISVETMFRNGHEVAEPYSLRRALTELDRRAPVDAGKLSVCRARIAEALATELKRVGELLNKGKPHEAWRVLTKIDVRFGGMASPETTQLEREFGSRR